MEEKNSKVTTMMTEFYSKAARSSFVINSLHNQPVFGMFSPQEPRWQSTLKAIEESLSTGSLVYRYNQNSPVNNLPGDEGTFCLCSFWFIENLANPIDHPARQTTS